jgi:hypothetical protein
MTYTFGSTRPATFKGQEITAPVFVLNTKNAYVGFRAFARRPEGDYVEVLEYAQEQMWVDGTNEGAWSASTYETSDQAFRDAYRAYRWLNNQRAAA